jgi:plastocyanin
MKAFRIASFSVVSAVVLLFGVLATGVAAPTAKARAAGAQVIHDINISGLSYTPNRLVIRKGDTVRWTITTGHDVQHDAQVKLFGMRDIVQNGQEVVTYEFTETGTYKFFCTPHAGLGMTGEILVAEFKSVYLPIMGRGR